MESTQHSTWHLVLRTLWLQESSRLLEDGMSRRRVIMTPGPAESEAPGQRVPREHLSNPLSGQTGIQRPGEAVRPVGSNPMPGIGALRGLFSEAG